jgi:hypothetical protein
MSYQVDHFRSYYRQQILPRIYSGIAHLMFSLTALLGTAVLLLTLIHNFSWQSLLIIPPMLITGSLVVFVVHKYLLHRPIPGLTFAYRIHTLYHHKFFTHNHVTWQSPRDFHIVFFPPLVVAGFCLLGAPLLYAGLSLLTEPNTALLGSATGVLYFFGYEVIHFCSHLPSHHWLIRRIPYLRLMREHHRHHHNPKRMHRANFNIVLPIWDWLLGAYERPINQSC